jgi:SAM-dependent methyltransferase
MPAALPMEGAIQPMRIVTISQPPPAANAPESGETLELDEAETHAVLSKPPPHRTPPPPAPPRDEPQPATRTPPPPAPVAAVAPPPARATAPTEPEGEEVSFEDDEPTPIAPPVDRLSDPGDAPEISPEDMVSVEAMPPPVTKPASSAKPALTPPVAFAPPMRSRAQSVPSMPPPKKGAPAEGAAAPSAAAPVSPVPAVAPAPFRPPLVIVPPHAGVQAPPTDSSARRKVRPWWEDLFNDDYIRTMAKITAKQIADEATFVEDSLGVAKGGTMLDLACGTGAHAIELARRGYEVVGFDLSLSMLARAADDAQDANAKLNFVQGDMREMTFDESFDGVYCWNTSFGFFDEETNAKVIGKIHKALKKGGQFMLDVANRDFIARQAPSLAWFDGDGCVCMDEMQVDWITSRMRVKRTLMMDDGRSKEIEYSVRLYALHELGKILHEQGFRVAEVSGRTATPGVFFGSESPRIIVLAEKR